MTAIEYRNRFADLNARLRRARFDNDDEAITVIEAEMNRILDLYNASRPASQQP